MKKNMFHITNIRWIMVGLLSMLILISCKKLIEIPGNPPNQLPQNAIFTDSAAVMGAMAGVYSYYPQEFGFTDGSLSKLTALSSDEISFTTNIDPLLPQFYTNKLATDNAHVGNFWTYIYSALYKVNVNIEGIQQSASISNALKQQLLGELKVLRALYYFNLANLFGGVPLVTSTDYKLNARLPRSTVDQVYDFIISDLLDASKKLKPDYPSEGHARPNFYTAEAFLAKVYLFRGQFQEAFQLSDHVIRSGEYQLETDLNKVFLNGSSEAIWQLPAQTTYSQTNEAMNYVPYSNTTVPNFVIAESLKNAFEPQDQRWTDWIGRNLVDVNGTMVEFYFPHKYKNLFQPFNTTEDFMIFRLSEQYLIRAEANAGLNRLTDALDDLYEVRHRAGLLKSGASLKEDVLKAISRERQVELFCEWGNRWYDLKRSKTIDAILGTKKPGWKAEAALFPIPLSETLKNTSLTQNPGYN